MCSLLEELLSVCVQQDSCYKKPLYACENNVIFSSQLVVEKPYQNWLTLTHLDGLQKILKLIDCVLSQSDRGVISDPNISDIFDIVTCDQSCKCRL